MAGGAHEGPPTGLGQEEERCLSLALETTWVLRVSRMKGSLFDHADVLWCDRMLFASPRLTSCIFVLSERSPLSRSRVDIAATELRTNALNLAFTYFDPRSVPSPATDCTALWIIRS